MSVDIAAALINVQILLNVTHPLSVRNPEATERPKFTKLMTAFLSNPSLLLKWTAKDLSVSLQASMLGAPLEEGRDLYQNLQFEYKDKGAHYRHGEH